MSEGDPNDYVLKTLRRCLEEAEKKRWQHVSIAGIDPDQGAALVFGGDLNVDTKAIEALDILRDRVKQNVKQWSLPPRDQNLGYDHVAFNCSMGPFSFDFLNWLINSELRRQQEKAPAPLKVGLWFGEGDAERAGRSIRDMWINNVFRPIMAMLGAVENPKAVYGHPHPKYLVTTWICDAYRSGRKLPRLKPLHPIFPRDDRVTITLRESGGDSAKERNSNFAAWLAFADYLKQSGERVVIVRDTAKAKEPIPGYETSAAASKDLHARMSLYHGAKVNMMVSNGPQGLVTYDDVPYLLFQKLESRGPNSAEWWEQRMGFKLGEGFPWANPLQRMIFRPDDYHTLVEEWESLKTKMRRAA